MCLCLQASYCRLREAAAPSLCRKSVCPVARPRDVTVTSAGARPKSVCLVPTGALCSRFTSATRRAQRTAATATHTSTACSTAPLDTHTHTHTHRQTRSLSLSLSVLRCHGQTDRQTDRHGYCRRVYFADGQTEKHGYGRCHYFSVMDRQTDRQTVAMQIADTDPHWSYELMSQMTDR